MPKRLTEEQRQEFEIWFWGLDKKGGFWAFWRGLNDLHNSSPGTRKEAYDELIKHSMEDLKEMEVKTRELAQWDRARKKKGEFVAQWKNLCRWMSKGAYERYVGSYNDLKEKSDIKCVKCDNKVMVKFTLCGPCQREYVAEHHRAAIEFCKSKGLDTREKQREWARRTLRETFNTMRGGR